MEPLADFPFRYLRTGERACYCRPCRARYRRARYERNKTDYISRAKAEMRMKREDALALVYDYLHSHPCVDRGEGDIVALEFDHVDPDQKTMDIATMIGHLTWPRILVEIQKCAVRCANCHRGHSARMEAPTCREAFRVPYNRGLCGCGVVVARNHPKVEARFRLPSPAQSERRAERAAFFIRRLRR